MPVERAQGYRPPCTLRDVLLALRFETRREPALLGLGGGGVDGLWRCLRGCAHATQASSEAAPRCALAVDVSQCYDTIEQRRVFELATSALACEAYSISGSSKRARCVGLETLDSESSSSRDGKRSKVRVVSRAALLRELRIRLSVSCRASSNDGYVSHVFPGLLSALWDTRSIEFRRNAHTCVRIVDKSSVERERERDRPRVSRDALSSKRLSK